MCGHRFPRYLAFEFGNFLLDRDPAGEPRGDRSPATGFPV